MLKFKRSFKTPHSPEAVYDLVNDIEAYPRFIPAVTKVETVTCGSAVVHYEYGLWRGSYRCEILRTPKRQIRIQSCDDVIEYMDCVWDFEPAANSTLIRFTINIRLRSVIRHMLLQTMFPRLAEMVFHTFRKRLEAALESHSPAKLTGNPGAAPANA